MRFHCICNHLYSLSTWAFLLSCSIFPFSCSLLCVLHCVFVIPPYTYATQKCTHRNTFSYMTHTTHVCVVCIIYFLQSFKVGNFVSPLQIFVCLENKGQRWLSGKVQRMCTQTLRTYVHVQCMGQSSVRYSTFVKCSVSQLYSYSILPNSVWGFSVALLFVYVPLEVELVLYIYTHTWVLYEFQTVSEETLNLPYSIHVVSALSDFRTFFLSVLLMMG